MIAIIDYGSGNPGSVKKAFDYLGEESIITSNVDEIIAAERVVFPGVGNFGNVMQEIKKKKIDQTIKQVIEMGKPFLGICIGLQILFEESEESLGVKGLSIFKGRCIKFTKAKIPQIGWNKIIPKKDSIFNESYMYFVNSYYVVPENKSIIATETDYYNKFTSAIQKNNITATQFHPEKSGKLGLEILKLWLKER